MLTTRDLERLPTPPMERRHPVSRVRTGLGVPEVINLAELDGGGGLFIAGEHDEPTWVGAQTRRRGACDVSPSSIPLTSLSYNVN
jgi:hypothetical protein